MIAGFPIRLIVHVLVDAETEEEAEKAVDGKTIDDIRSAGHIIDEGRFEESLSYIDLLGEDVLIDAVAGRIDEDANA